MTDQLLQNQEEAYRAWRNIIEPQPVPPVSLASRIKGLLGIAEVNPYSRMALGKDISHWDDLTVDDPRVRGVDFLVAKMGGSENNPRTPMGNPYIDDKFNRYAQLAYDLPNPQGGLGVPLIVYWMSGVRVYQDNGMTELNLHQCSESTHPVFSLMLQAWHSGSAWKQVKEFFFDYEEPCYWMDLPFTIDEYWARLFHEELRGDRLIHKMKAGESPYPFPTIPLGLYSRRSFMEAHYQKNPYNLWDWLIQHPELSTWPANYPRKVPATASVEEVRASWLPLATWKPYALRDDGSWTYWQFAGDPDWDLYNGTPAELYERLGFEPRTVVVPPDPDPEPEPTKRYFATIRAGITVLKLRTAPSKIAPILVNGFRPAGRFEITKPVVDGAITWAGLGKYAWFGVREGSAIYADVVEETVG